MSKRQDLEADVSEGGQQWHEPDSADFGPCGLVHTIGSGNYRSRGIREVYAPVTTPHPEIDRAIREVSEAEIRGAFIRGDKALRHGG